MESVVLYRFFAGEPLSVVYRPHISDEFVNGLWVCAVGIGFPVGYDVVEMRSFWFWCVLSEAALVPLVWLRAEV